MKLVDVDFKDGIKATFVDNTKQLIQIHYDVDVLSAMFGGRKITPKRNENTNSWNIVSDLSDPLP